MLAVRRENTVKPGEVDSWPGHQCGHFCRGFAAHGGDAQAITDVSLDLGRAYQAGARQQCPNAKVSFDPFHAVALANKALDQVRRAEMHWLQRSGLKTARTWRLKQQLREVLAQCNDVASAEALLLLWINGARRCRLVPFKRLGATVKRHLAGILEHFRCGLNNSFAEAITGRIQAAKVRAKSYGTDAHLITISYLVCAKLKHLPENPWIHPA